MLLNIEKIEIIAWSNAYPCSTSDLTASSPFETVLQHFHFLEAFLSVTIHQGWPVMLYCCHSLPGPAIQPTSVDWMSLLLFERESNSINIVLFQKMYNLTSSVIYNGMHRLLILDFLIKYFTKQSKWSRHYVIDTSQDTTRHEPAPLDVSQAPVSRLRSLRVPSSKQSALIPAEEIRLILLLIKYPLSQHFHHTPTIRWEIASHCFLSIKN